MTPKGVGGLRIETFPDKSGDGKKAKYGLLRMDSDLGERLVSPLLGSRSACLDWLKKSGLVKK
jgi:predicted small integral membrane protein